MAPGALSARAFAPAIPLQWIAFGEPFLEALRLIPLTDRDGA
jgi:hypothetical protein